MAKTKSKTKRAAKPKSKPKSKPAPKVRKPARPAKSKPKAAPRRAAPAVVAPAAPPVPAGPQPIPPGHHTVTPHLIVKDTKKAIEWYSQAFGAQLHFVLPGPDGFSIVHAEFQIGDSILYAADEMPQYGAMGPGPTTPVVMHVYVTDADAVFNRAVAAGATVVTPLSDMFWGDRYGKLRDPFGHEWSIATHKEDVPPDQMAERMKKAFGAC